MRCGGVRVHTRPERSPFARALWEARVGRGRKLRDVAAALSWPPRRLDELENGRAEPTEAERAALERLWGPLP
jgi:ribosome-binding protein aMBF1 (putative translation factor)